MSGTDREDAVRRKRALLYVAATRAGDELVILWHRDAIPLVPQQIIDESSHG